MKKILALLFAAMVVISFSGCGSPPPTASPTASPTAAALPTDTPAPTDTLAPATSEPSALPTETPLPSPTAEDADSAGSGSVLFDIYQSAASVDINKDGTAEEITFTSGDDKSVLQIDGTSYDVPKPRLAQLFAVTDIDTTDKYLEFVFTDKYDAGLADSEKAFSWMYWWNGTKLILMGGLMDVKFDGAWRSTFKAADCVSGKDGQVACLTNSTELTDIWYIAWYRPAGKDRKLSEWRHTAAPVNEVGQLTCKTVCLLQTNHDETSRNNTYMNSEFDYYWIPTLSPTTLGRVLNPAPGIKIIAQVGEKLTIMGTYGKTWFKVKTHDGYIGWIYCKGKHVGGYYTSMGWTAEDMFDGLVSAG
jgi:hypothetical protein